MSLRSYLTSDVPAGVRVYLPHEVDPEIAKLRARIEKQDMTIAAQINPERDWAARIAKLESAAAEISKHCDLYHAENQRLSAENAGLKSELQQSRNARDLLYSENAGLREAIDDMLIVFGRPHKEEYVDGGASYKMACDAVSKARSAIGKK